MVEIVIIHFTNNMSYYIYGFLNPTHILSKKTLLNQEAHGQHCWFEKQFQSIGTFAQSYDYTIALRDRNLFVFFLFLFFDGTALYKNLNPILTKLHCYKFGWNGSSGSGEKDENVKSLQTDRQSDRRRTTGDKKIQLRWAKNDHINRNTDICIYIVTSEI